MKKLISSLLLASTLIATSTVNAQGFFSKMKDKLESAATQKGTFYYYFENISKQEKAKEILTHQSFSVIDENNLAWKGTSKYGGDPDKTYKKIELAGMQQAVFNDGSYHNTIIKIENDVFFKVSFQGTTCEMKNVTAIEVFSTNKEFIKTILKDDKCENYKKLETALNDFIKAEANKDAANKAQEDKKQSELAANRKLPVPTKINPCNQAKLKALCQTRVGNDKIIYCYFGVPDMLKQVSPTNDWKMIKEKKTVKGTYDDFITKRRIFAICIYESPANDDKTTYNYTCITIEEEHAFDVWDGSKFNGELKATGTMYLGRIGKENAIQYKNVLK
jgi:hypothetical protein